MQNKYNENNKEKIETIRAGLDRPVVLIGLMGVGKTRIGHMLGEALSLDFVDADDEIEAAAGMAIADIFEQFGEDYFRDGERRVMMRLLGEGVKIIATGGGAVMNPETAQAIWDGGLSIWIRADIPVILDRTARNDKRPLLRVEDPEAVLRDLAAVRYPVYEQADMVLESGHGSPEYVLEEALDALYDYVSGNKAEKR